MPIMFIVLLHYYLRVGTLKPEEWNQNVYGSDFASQIGIFLVVH